MDPTAILEHEVASRPQVEDYSRLSGSQTLHFTIKVSDCDPSTEHRLPSWPEIYQMIVEYPQRYINPEELPRS